MYKELFGQPYDDRDPQWVIKGYFDIMYSDGNFLKAIKLLSEKSALNTDGAYCHFPDMEGPDDAMRFEGVMFAWGYPPSDEDTVIVSEKTCFHYVHLASELYLQKHPEDTEKVNQILANIPE